MEPIRINIFAIAFLALVSSLSRSLAENQVPGPKDGGKKVLLEPSSISSAVGSQNVHFFKKLYAAEKRKLSSHERSHGYKSLKTNPSVDCQNSEKCAKLKKRYERAAPETSNIVFPNENTETTTISNEELKKVLAQVLSVNTNEAASTGQQGKNETRSLVYEDLNFVTVDLDAFGYAAGTGDVANRAEGLEPERPTDSNAVSLTYPASMIDVPPNAVYLTYPASMIDVPPNLLTFPRRLGNDLSTTNTTTEDPDTSDPADDEDGVSIITSEESKIKCTTPKLIKKDRRVADIKCEENMWNIYNKLICPFLSEDISGVYGATFSQEGEFPHAGAVGWQKNPPEDNTHIYLCGSSLIHSNYALTAAHCQVLNNDDQIKLHLKSPNPQVVAFGSVKIDKDNESKLLKAVIDRFITHPDYKPPVKYNDIALIKFKNDVKLKNNIRPACIWNGDLRGEHKEGSIIGWGKTETGQSSSHLKSAMVPFITHHKCNRLLIMDKMRHWNDGIIETQFCAAHPEGKIDTCLGDSGGPIQVIKSLPKDKDTMIAHVVGVTSFGPGKNCAEKGKAGIYTNVTSYLCWIEKVVWPEEDNSKCRN